MRWIRLWVKETLEGSTFQELDVKERGVWFSLLVMAGASYDHGVVQLRINQGHTIQSMSDFLACGKEELESALRKLVKVKKIELIPDANDDDRFFIKIVNWKKYQTMYDRYEKSRYEEKKKANREELKQLSQLADSATKRI